MMALSYQNWVNFRWINLWSTYRVFKVNDADIITLNAHKAPPQQSWDCICDAVCYLICFFERFTEQELHMNISIRTHVSRDTWTAHLLDVVVQSDDGKRAREIGTAGDRRARWSWFRDEALISGHLEIRRLIVLIKHLDVEIGERRQRMSVILLCLRKITQRNGWRTHTTPSVNPLLSWITAVAHTQE